MRGADIRLAVNYFPAGWHEAIWHDMADPAGIITDTEYFVWLAQAAEAAKLDALFLADTIGGLQVRSHRSPWGGLDPTTLLASIASVTSNIGLVATISAVFGNPVDVARRVASLDHVSRGRAAWNVVTSQAPTSRSVYGVREEYSDPVRYERAAEYAQIVDGFWESLPREAFIADTASGVFLDAARTNPVAFQGRHFAADGVLPITSGPFGKPLVFQAGSSDASIDYGVRFADALFTARRDLRGAQHFVDEVHRRAAAVGRHRTPLVLPGAFIYPGATEKEAIERKAELDDRINFDVALPLLAARIGVRDEVLKLDEPLPYELIPPGDGTLAADRITGLPEQVVDEARRNGWTVRQILTHNGLGAHRVIVGSGEQIADDLIAWVDAGAADGFVLSFGDYRHDFPIFAETTLPRLQRLGRFRRDYDAPRTTLRQNLGIPHEGETP